MFPPTRQKDVQCAESCAGASGVRLEAAEVQVGGEEEEGGKEEGKGAEGPGVLGEDEGG